MRAARETYASRSWLSGMRVLLLLALPLLQALLARRTQSCHKAFQGCLIPPPLRHHSARGGADGPEPLWDFTQAPAKQDPVSRQSMFKYNIACNNAAGQLLMSVKHSGTYLIFLISSDALVCSDAPTSAVIYMHLFVVTVSLVS